MPFDLCQRPSPPTHHTLNRLPAREDATEKTWLKEYPAGIPSEVDVHAYSSLKELLEKSSARFRDLPATATWTFLSPTVSSTRPSEISARTCRKSWGSCLTAEELIAHCKKQLTGYKLPKAVEFRTEPLPKTNIGKVTSGGARSSCEKASNLRQYYVPPDCYVWRKERSAQPFSLALGTAILR
jgi:hypothetical protein